MSPGEKNLRGSAGQKFDKMVPRKQDWQVSKTTVKERFKELLTLEQWTDCIFSVGEEEELIRGHKLVLAVSSPVFEALFFGKLADSSGEPIRVPDMDPYIFKLLLQYIYSDSLELTDVDVAAGMLYAAEKYLMPQLSRLCLDHLKENTCIKTIWEILAVAEFLDQEELLSPCVKVMCRYPKEVWESFRAEDVPTGRRALSLLFQESSVNSKEWELWRIAQWWAEKECLRRSLPTNEAAKRSVLEESGILENVRFLSMSKDEFMSKVQGKGILKKEEELALIRALENSEDEEFLPGIFSKCRMPRAPPTQMTWHANREVLSQGKIFLTGGRFETRVSPSSRVLILGFEIFTRAAQSGPPVSYRPHSYNESLVLLIKSGSGDVLAETQHEAQGVPFNSLQTVHLSRPIWFEAGENYSVIAHFSNARYPLASFAESVCAKGTSFLFDDLLQRNISLNVSFISSILYTL